MCLSGSKWVWANRNMWAEKRQSDNETGSRMVSYRCLEQKWDQMYSVRYVLHMARRAYARRMERKRKRRHITNMHLRPIIWDTPVQTTLYIRFAEPTWNDCLVTYYLIFIHEFIFTSKYSIRFHVEIRSAYMRRIIIIIRTNIITSHTHFEFTKKFEP